MPGGEGDDAVSAYTRLVLQKRKSTLWGYQSNQYKQHHKNETPLSLSDLEGEEIIFEMWWPMSDSQEPTNWVRGLLQNHNENVMWF